MADLPYDEMESPETIVSMAVDEAAEIEGRDQIEAEEAESITELTKSRKNRSKKMKKNGEKLSSRNCSDTILRRTERSYERETKILITPFRYNLLLYISCRSKNAKSRSKNAKIIYSS